MIRYALFKNDKQIGPARKKEWEAATDAREYDGIADTAEDYGMDWLIYFKTGYEVRRVA